MELKFRAKHSRSNRWYDVVGILWNYRVVKVFLSPDEAANYGKEIDYLAMRNIALYQSTGNINDLNQDVYAQFQEQDGRYYMAGQSGTELTFKAYHTQSRKLHDVAGFDFHEHWVEVYLPPKEALSMEKGSEQWDLRNVTLLQFLGIEKNRQVYQGFGQILQADVPANMSVLFP